jgi:large subunit ribosomal protein L29
MKRHELRELTRGELQQRMLDLQDERFNLVMRRSLKQLDNPLRLRTIRREAAQINTMLREDELGIRPLAQSKTSILSAVDSGKSDTK